MTGYSNGSDEQAEDYAMRCRMAEADDELSMQRLYALHGEKGWHSAAPETTTHKDNSMKLASAFPSKWLSADDLGGKAHRLTIETVNQETVGQGADAEVKLVAYFRGAKKGVILNKTNANAIASKYGDETDDWSGAEVEVYPTPVTFQGVTKDAIRIRVPVPAASPDDSIPF